MVQNVLQHTTVRCCLLRDAADVEIPNHLCEGVVPFAVKGDIFLVTEGIINRGFRVLLMIFLAEDEKKKCVVFSACSRQKDRNRIKKHQLTVETRSTKTPALK